MKRNINIDIGKRVREKREYMKYSKEQLAEILGISPKFLADIELGTKECPLIL